MARLRQVYDTVLELLGLLAGVIVGLLALFVSIDVVIRNLGIGNFPWLLEVAEYALYIATFIAAPWVLRQGAHVRVDLLFSVVGRRGARALERIVNVLGLVISLILFWFGADAFLDSWRLGSLIFKELVVPEWWLLLFIPLSTLLLAVEFALRLRRPVPDHDGPGPAPARDGP